MIGDRRGGAGRRARGPCRSIPESTVLIRMARLEWRRAVYLRLDHRQPDLPQRDALPGRRGRGDRQLRRSPTTSPADDGRSNRWGTGLRRSECRAPGRTRRFPPRPRPNPPRLTPGTQPPGPVAEHAGPGPARERDPDPPRRLRPRRPIARSRRRDYAKLADEVLVDSWNVARKIDRLIWKNRAMVRIALSASDSRQYQPRRRAGADDRERRIPLRGPAAPGRGAVPPRAGSERRDADLPGGRRGGGLDPPGRPARGHGRVPGRQPDRLRPLRRRPGLHRALSRGIRAVRRPRRGRRGAGPARAWPRRPAAGSPPRPPKPIARRCIGGS